MKLRLPILIFAITILSCMNSSSESAVVEGTQQQTKVQFLPTGSVDGVTEDGSRFSSEAFESNGTGVTVTRIYYANKASARRALAQKLETSTAIVESATLLSNKRHLRGKRLIARFGDKNTGHDSILWTQGNTLFIIESSSFRSALLLEKSFFPK